MDSDEHKEGTQGRSEKDIDGATRKRVRTETLELKTDEGKVGIGKGSYILACRKKKYIKDEKNI